MKIELEPPRDRRHGIAHWATCLPFVENSRAVLIHRVRSVTVHRISDKYRSHLAVHTWCGASQTGTKKFTFLDAPPEDRTVCARCEDTAVDRGRQSSFELVGRHVHTGGVVAVNRCCDGGNQPGVAHG